MNTELHKNKNVLFHGLLGLGQFTLAAPMVMLNAWHQSGADALKPVESTQDLVWLMLASIPTPIAVQGALRASATVKAFCVNNNDRFHEFFGQFQTRCGSALLATTAAIAGGSFLLDPHQHQVVQDALPMMMSLGIAGIPLVMVGSMRTLSKKLALRLEDNLSGQWVDEDIHQLRQRLNQIGEVINHPLKFLKSHLKKVRD